MYSMVKNPGASATASAKAGLIPGLGRSPGEGNGDSLKYSCLENSMDRRAWSAPDHGVAKCQTRRSDSHFHFHWDAAKYSTMHTYSKWTKIHPVQNFNRAEAEKHWCKWTFLLSNHIEVHFEVSQLFFAKWIATKKSVVDEAISQG